MNKLVASDNPMLLYPKLAERFGLNEAIVLHQIHYWTEKNRLANKQYRDGYYWVYNSYEKWREQFTWWSVDTIKRTFRSLEKKGVVISGSFNKVGYDKTKWYRIDYSALGLALNDGAESAVHGGKLPPPIPETNIETNNGQNGDNGDNGSVGYADRTAHSCICVPKVKKSDESISGFMEWYFALYRQMKGEEHPPIKSAQRIRVHDTLKNFCIENEMDADGLKVMAESFFDVSTSDHNINHFATAGILENRFYETLY